MFFSNLYFSCWKPPIPKVAKDFPTVKNNFWCRNGSSQEIFQEIFESQRIRQNTNSDFFLYSYLLRNFKLFQLESTYEIRGDVEDAATRLKPWTADDGQVVFGGWARMALPLLTFCIVEVAKPNIGEKQPSRVRADITVNLSLKDDIKSEWEGLRRHDVVFLVTVRPPVNSSANPGVFDFDQDFVSQVT